MCGGGGGGGGGDATLPSSNCFDRHQTIFDVNTLKFLLAVKLFLREVEVFMN